MFTTRRVLCASEPFPTNSSGGQSSAANMRRILTKYWGVNFDQFPYNTTMKSKEPPYPSDRLIISEHGSELVVIFRRESPITLKGGMKQNAYVMQAEGQEWEIIGTEDQKLIDIIKAAFAPFYRALREREAKKQP